MSSAHIRDKIGKLRSLLDKIEELDIGPYGLVTDAFLKTLEPEEWEAIYRAVLPKLEIEVWGDGKGVPTGTVLRIFAPANHVDMTGVEYRVVTPHDPNADPDNTAENNQVAKFAEWY